MTRAVRWGRRWARCPDRVRHGVGLQVGGDGGVAVIELERLVDVAHLFDVVDAFHLVGGGLLDGGDLFVAKGFAFAELPGVGRDADGEGVVEIIDVHPERDGEGRLHLACRHHLARLVLGDGVGRQRNVEPLA